MLGGLPRALKEKKTVRHRLAKAPGPSEDRRGPQTGSQKVLLDPQVALRLRCPGDEGPADCEGLGN